MLTVDEDSTIWRRGLVSLATGNCLALLRMLPDASIHCCVTSPPYWGLRDYGTATWDGGDPTCAHKPRDRQGRTGERADRTTGHTYFFRDTCDLCGAHRIDHQLGMEPTPEEYVANMVAVFREVRRVLRNDGTLWLNLGDTYNAYNGNRGRRTSFQSATEEACPTLPSAHGLLGKTLKPKDLVGIPWRVAFALQEDGWYLRQDVIWHKPNQMPESVRDRCTKAHEYVFLLTKSARYFYDAVAVHEPASYPGVGGNSFGHVTHEQAGSRRFDETERETCRGATRNRRSVWTITTQPFPGAHFAVMPPALVEPMILAGCPADCCPQCGKGWRRHTKKTSRTSRPNSRPLGSRGGQPSLEASLGQPQQGGRTVETHTTGFAPACACGAAESMPGVVLDPFAGAGTTLLVGHQLGRRSVGIELNAEYCEIAQQRITRMQEEQGLPLFLAAAEVDGITFTNQRTGATP